MDYEEIDAALARTGDFFGLRITENSMEPRMRGGDVVIVRQQDTAETGDTVVVLVNGDSATGKKIKYGLDGITLLPTNPTHDSLFYSAAEVEQHRTWKAQYRAGLGDQWCESGRLGHSQASTTANIYAHAIQSADAIAAEALGNILAPAAPVSVK